MTNPCGEDSTCDTNRMTLRVRWGRLKWFTVGIIGYRMKLLTGFLAHKRRLSPVNPVAEPERRLKRRPPHWIRTPWFKLRGMHGNVKHRFELLTGWYDLYPKIAFYMIKTRTKPGQFKATVPLKFGDEIIQRPVSDKLARRIDATLANVKP